ncbi:MAG: DUF2065 domain-containing protein [Pseudomonadota bacterium]
MELTDVLKAIAFVLLFEGAAYALFPDGMRNAMREMLQLPTEALRIMGLIAVTLSLCIFWFFANYLGGI